MGSEELAELAVAALEALKALDIQTLDVQRLTDVTDFMIIAAGRSNRQVRALAKWASKVGEARLRRSF